MSAYSHVMEGYRVLDFSQFVAGSVAGRMLAEMGAEVIKVEIAPNGDGSRTYAVFKDRRSAFFVQHNRGKKSLCINPKTAAGLEILKGLVVCNQRCFRTVDLGQDHVSAFGPEKGFGRLVVVIPTPLER